MARLSKGYTKREQKEDRKFQAIIYPDSKEYDCQQLLERLKYYWTKYYYVLHDKDEYLEEDFDRYVAENDGKEPDWKVGDKKKPHYHVIGYTDSPCLLGRAAIKFGIPSNQVQQVKNMKSAVSYLIHMNNPEKYQYGKEEVKSNDTSIEKYFKRETTAEEKAEALVTAILTTDVRSITALANWAINNGCWDELRRGQHIYTAMIYEKIRSDYNTYEESAAKEAAAMFGGKT